MQVERRITIITLHPRHHHHQCHRDQCYHINNILIMTVPTHYLPSIHHRCEIYLRRSLGGPNVSLTSLPIYPHHRARQWHLNQLACVINTVSMLSW